MATTAKKVYDGLTEHVTPAEEAERIKRTLYRTDDSRLGTVLPEFRARWTEDDLRQYREQGYLAINGLFSAEDVAAARAALADLARRREELAGKLGIQEEPYYRQTGEAAIDDPELRIRKLWRFESQQRIVSDATRSSPETYRR